MRSKRWRMRRAAARLPFVRGEKRVTVTPKRRPRRPGCRVSPIRSTMSAGSTARQRSATRPRCCLGELLGDVHSNTPTRGTTELADVWQSRQHTLVDPRRRRLHARAARHQFARGVHVAAVSQHHVEQESLRYSRISAPWRWARCGSAVVDASVRAPAREDVAPRSTRRVLPTLPDVGKLGSSARGRISSARRPAARRAAAWPRKQNVPPL